ncbi:hypothetical protein [Marinobacter sp. DUT-1]|uniref:hypothetical protein n=1 Tax=Marinobacter sp. DUT-1 TaxID=3412037 RepID=UPI003D186819
MGLLWDSGSTGYQKIKNTVFVIPAVLMLLNAFGLRNFLPAPSYERFSLFAAIGVTVWGFILIFYGRAVGEQRPNLQWYEYSRKMKYVAILAAPFLILLFNYVAIAYTLPHLVTKVVGEPETIAYEVVRDRGGGRYTCKYRIINDDMTVPFVQLCVSEVTWYRLPVIPFTAEFSVQKSSLGMIFKEIRVTDSGGAGEEATGWANIGF